MIVIELAVVLLVVIVELAVVLVVSLLVLIVLLVLAVIALLVALLILVVLLILLRGRTCGRSALRGSGGLALRTGFRGNLFAEIAALHVVVRKIRHGGFVLLHARGRFRRGGNVDDAVVVGGEVNGRAAGLVHAGDHDLVRTDPAGESLVLRIAVEIAIVVETELIGANGFQAVAGSRGKGFDMLDGRGIVIAVFSEIRVGRAVAGSGGVGRRLGPERGLDRRGGFFFRCRFQLQIGRGIHGGIVFGAFFRRTAAAFFHGRVGFRFHRRSGLLRHFILCGILVFGLHCFHFVGHLFFLSDVLL